MSENWERRWVKLLRAIALIVLVREVRSQQDTRFLLYQLIKIKYCLLSSQ